MKLRLSPSAGELPCSHIGELFIIAFCFAFFRLVFFAEMAAARFFAMQRVARHKLAKFEEVRKTPGALELVVQTVISPHDLHISPELLS